MPLIQLAHSGLSVRTYDPPPGGFDPLTAPESLLVHHGYAARPDPEAEPALFQLWKKFFASAKSTYIVPEFHMVEGLVHGPRKRVEDQAAGTSSNWSGSVLQADPGKSFLWIEGRWTVPNPYPSTNSGWDYCSQWVGIDGSGSGDVLQAGTETDVQQVGLVTMRSIYTWWEWFPAPSMVVSNIPVAAGDVFWCLICVNNATTGSIYLNNISSGVNTSFTVNSPPDPTNPAVPVQLVGNSAEWVVERPSFLDVNGNLVPTTLADYSLVYFDEGQAAPALGAPGGATASGPLAYIGTGDLISMIDNNQIISYPVAEGSQSLEMDFQ